MTDEQSPRGRGRRAGRPSAPVLDRDRIAETALALVTDEGQSRLTMKRLADRLGVAVSALYNHIRNKADLLLLVEDAVMSGVDASALGALTEADGAVGAVGAAAGLPDALRHWARSYREVFAAFPELVPLIATMPVSGAPATRRMYDTVASGLVAAGVPRDRVVSVVIAFESFLYGSAMDANAPTEIFSSAPEETDAPVFQDVVSAFTVRVSDDSDGRGTANPYADDPFEWGLEALVARAVALADPHSGTDVI
ncbi:MULTISPECIES: TetR/AcrR family transcriptional regulator [unclassified Corynebacterium]|uniref:TetR/AcrR family transcriptional regulator n=1 Tax=unclassified Corynebacterium TaxID=2624378 RepID=UPI0026498BCB|nr:TetR/AcrR family transcriptional regulator [Corynebacterium sp.]MDN5720019.1 TetR/AcrR family transcriptional regulator [Corynebacterium sp.]